MLDDLNDELSFFTEYSTAHEGNILLIRDALDHAYHTFGEAYHTFH
jgi:hypothetical protein